LGESKAVADAAHRRGDLNEAVTSYRAALLLLDGGGGSRQSSGEKELALAYRCRLSLALCLLKRGDAKDAMFECSELLDARPRPSATVR
jgi:hypothetical protein